MPIETDIDDKFRFFTDNTYNPDETTLFTKFEDALLDVIGVTPCFKSVILHGNRMQVEFCHKARYVKNAGMHVTTELCDTMFWVIYKRASGYKARLTFMQFKYESEINHIINDEFSANLHQYYLLHNRPKFYVKRYLNKNDILKTRKYPSVGSYGVFFYDGYRYNMKYYSAHILRPLHRTGTGKERLIHKVPTVTRFIDQVDQADSFVSFMYHLLHGHIGKEFSLKDAIEFVNNPNISRRLSEICDTGNIDLEQYDDCRPQIETSNIYMFFNDSKDDNDRV